MMKRKFDELISYFNLKVSKMNIDRKYKMELLGMITAIGLEHEKEMPHWIPCSERLPKKNGFYLCTTKDCITILEFIAGNPHYHEESSFVSDVLGKCNSYVVAWMPLPEVYREGE